MNVSPFTLIILVIAVFAVIGFQYGISSGAPLMPAPVQDLPIKHLDSTY